MSKVVTVVRMNSRHYNKTYDVLYAGKMNIKKKEQGNKKKFKFQKKIQFKVKC